MKILYSCLQVEGCGGVNLVVNAWRKCKMKSARIYGREAYASGKVTALSFKRGEKKRFQ